MLSQVLLTGILVLRAWVAQSVEQWIENPCVGGSIPSPGTTRIRYLSPGSFRGFFVVALGFLYAEGSGGRERSERGEVEVSFVGGE